MTIVAAIAYMLIVARLWLPVNGFIASRLLLDAASRPTKIRVDFALVNLAQALIACLLVFLLWAFVAGHPSMLIFIICAPFTLFFVGMIMGGLFSLLMMLVKEPVVVMVGELPRFAMKARR